MRRWIGWMTAGAALVAGCDLGKLGEHVARLRVEAVLRENSCGDAAGGVPARTTLDVDLYERDGMLTWMASGGTFQAAIDPEGSFVFRASSRTTLRDEVPTYDGVRAACVVDQVEEISGRLVRPIRPDEEAGIGADEARPASVAATDTLQVSPAAGADCSDFVGAGLYGTLPCRVVVDLQGEEE